MKFESGSRYIVFDLDGNEKGELVPDPQGDPIWPAGVKGWKHALDCTVEPYHERSIDENLAFAKHVNKFVIVMEV